MSRQAPFRTRLVVDGKTVRTRLEQPNESEILAANRKAQQTPGGRGWGGRVTDIERERWRREGRQDLLRGERKALEKYFAGEGRRFSTAPRGKARSFSFGGL